MHTPRRARIVGMLLAVLLLVPLLTVARPSVAAPAQPVLLKNINTQLTGSNPSELTTIGATTFFTANDGVSGAELWQSDGSVTGTTLVKDIIPGAGGSNPGYLTLAPTGLFFIANGGVTGREPWLLPLGASLASSNGSSGAAGSAFGFTAGGFPAGASVTISVTPPAAQGASVAATGGNYVVGNVTADTSGAVTFAVQLAKVAQAGAYTVTASDSTLSASAQVTVSATAPLLNAPDGVPALRGLPSVFLPMLKR